jgi:competence protein ComEC
MNRDSWTIFCIAYAIGLLSTSIFGFNPHPSWQQWLIVIGGLGFLSILAAIVIPRFWRRGLKWQLWLATGLIAILAAAYFQVRTPQPANDDISKILEQKKFIASIQIEGKALTQGRLNSDRRVQFWFEATKLLKTDKPVTGKLYVTIGLSKEQNIYPGQQLIVTGSLYQPRSPDNPSSFDFKAYLARQGAFAGLKGKQIEIIKEPSWGWWQLRQRIVDAQTHTLGNREGLLVSSMVLGQRAVNLPGDIRDIFIRAGLAHILAASGFQVSLLLGAVLKLTERFSSRNQLIFGLGILLLYASLTGIQPSVARATVMGIGGLIALVSDRKIKQLGSLLVAGTILLLWNPLWIWDLGFQLSFLATFGLIVTMPALEKRLDWLPPAIATIVALPLAASLWTFPLLLNVFSVVSTYSILANIVTAPLVTAISLGGMLSAGAAVIYPSLGSAIAWLLYYPTHFLIQIVQFFTILPGSSLAVGKLSLALMLLIYALMGLVWVNRWWQPRWWLMGILILFLIVVPIRYHRLNLTQITVFATKQEPVLVIQNRGQVFLINSGDRDTTKYTLTPFFNRQGINQIDYAVAFGSEIKNLSIKEISSDRVISNSTEIQSLEKALQIKIQEQIWLLVKDNSIDKTTIEKLPKTVSVLLWSGKYLSQKWLDIVKPKVAIAISRTVDPEIKQQLKQRGIQLYWTGRDGAISWRRDRGFETTIELNEEEIE